MAIVGQIWCRLYRFRLGEGTCSLHYQKNHISYQTLSFLSISKGVLANGDRYETFYFWNTQVFGKYTVP